MINDGLKEEMGKFAALSGYNYNWSLLLNFALYPDYEFDNPCTRYTTELDSFRGCWRYRGFVIIIIKLTVSLEYDKYKAV